MKRVTHYTEREASDFFARLAAYSADYVRRRIPAVHRAWPSDNFYRDWRGGSPRGHVLHWTGGVNFAGTIRHFVLGHSASSNWVVAKALDVEFARLREDLELTGDLRAEVCQIVPPEFPAWSAGWVNRLVASTEARNAGFLRPVPKGAPVGAERMNPARLRVCADHPADEVDLFWWPEGWTTPFRGEARNVGGYWMETWSRGQIATIIVLLRYLNSLYPGALDPSWFIAHHQVSRTKNDVRLPLPLPRIAEAALFSTQHVDDIPWLAAEYDDFEDDFEDADDPWMLRELDERAVDRAEEDLEDFDPDVIEGVIDSRRESVEALRRMGFWLPRKSTSAAREFYLATRIYQRGRELRVDGDAGPATNGALRRELDAWGLR